METCKTDTQVELDGYALVDSFKRSIKALVYKSKTIKGNSKYSYPYFDSLMGYKGANTATKNFVNEPQRSLVLHRFLKLMNELSNAGDHSLHKCLINTAKFHIVPRSSTSEATGDFMDAAIDGDKALKLALRSIHNKDIEGSKEAYFMLQKVVAKLGSEIRVQEIMLKKEGKE